MKTPLESKHGKTPEGFSFLSFSLSHEWKNPHHNPQLDVGGC